MLRQLDFLYKSGMSDTLFTSLITRLKGRPIKLKTKQFKISITLGTRLDYCDPIIDVNEKPRQ